MNISSAILDIYNIGPMTFAEYEELINSETKRTTKYRIKHETRQNGLLIQNMKNAKPFMLHCVREYYSPTNYKLNNSLACSEIKDVMNIEGVYSCLECHKKCCSLYTNNELNKITK